MNREDDLSHIQASALKKKNEFSGIMLSGELRFVKHQTYFSPPDLNCPRCGTDWGDGR